MAYTANINPQKGKFDGRSVMSIFVGYMPGQKGYKLYNLETQKMFVARDVIFHENVFPLSKYDQNDTISPLPKPTWNDYTSVSNLSHSLPPYVQISEATLSTTHLPNTFTTPPEPLQINTTPTSYINAPSSDISPQGF